MESTSNPSTHSATVDATARDPINVAPIYSAYKELVDAKATLKAFERDIWQRLGPVDPESEAQSRFMASVRSQRKAFIKGYNKQLIRAGESLTSLLRLFESAHETSEHHSRTLLSGSTEITQTLRDVCKNDLNSGSSGSLYRHVEFAAQVSICHDLSEFHKLSQTTANVARSQGADSHTVTPSDLINWASKTSQERADQIDRVDYLPISVARTFQEKIFAVYTACIKLEEALESATSDLSFSFPPEVATSIREAYNGFHTCQLSLTKLEQQIWDSLAPADTDDLLGAMFSHIFNMKRHKCGEGFTETVGQIGEQVATMLSLLEFQDGYVSAGKYREIANAVSGISSKLKHAYGHALTPFASCAMQVSVRYDLSFSGDWDQATEGSHVHNSDREDSRKVQLNDMMTAGMGNPAEDRAMVTQVWSQVGSLTWQLDKAIIDMEKACKTLDKEIMDCALGLDEAKYVQTAEVDNHEPKAMTSSSSCKGKRKALMMEDRNLESVVGPGKVIPLEEDDVDW